MPDQIPDTTELHSRLEEHFRALRQVRSDRSVYLLEYGRSGVTRQELEIVVQHGLAHSPCSSSWWSRRYLPLLVLATEAGYEYEGPGHDFWDGFQRVSSRLFDATDRVAFSGWFRDAVTTLGIAEPPESPWSNHFCHIAWPITHAVLPKDLQRALTVALSELPFAVTDATPTDRLVDGLSWVAHERFGTRFEQWLKNRDLVSSLVPALLERGEDCWLEGSLVQRIRQDIEETPEAEEQLQIARVRQERLERQEEQAKGTSRPSTRAPETRWASLIVSQAEDGRLALSIRTPPWGRELIVPMRDALAGRRYAPSLWGCTAPIRLDRVLSGYPVELRVLRFPASGTPMLTDLGEQPFSSRLRQSLSAFQCDLTCPMAFVPSDEGYVQVRGRQLPAEGSVLVLLVPEASIDDQACQRRGELCDHPCVEVDLDSARGQAWLRQLGFELRGAVSLRWVGSPPFASSGDPQFASGDAIALRASCQVGGTLADAESTDTMEIGDGDVIAVQPRLGTVTLELSSPQGSATASAWVGSGVDRGLVCWAEWSGERTIRALLNGDFALRLQSQVPLEDVSVRLSLHANSAELSSIDGQLDALPATLGSSSTFWKAVLSDEIAIGLRPLSEVTVRVAVGRLWYGELRFEQEPLAHWWSRDGEAVVALSENGPLETEAFLCTAPLDRGTCGIDGGVELLLPVQDSEAVAGGLCIGSEVQALQWEGAEPPRLLRQVEDRGDGVGLRRLVQASLRWSLATADNLAVEVRRRQVAVTIDRWATEAVCGTRWIGVESGAVRNAARTAASALVAACARARQDGVLIGFDEYVLLLEHEYRAIEPFLVRSL